MQTVKSQRGCSTPASGNFVFQDDYGIIYRVSWETSRSGFDITTVIQDPRVPGEPGQGYKVGNALFRRGIVTVDRQILVDTADGYLIQSAGGSQHVDFFQSSFPCGPKPVDPFCYHVDNPLSEETDFIVTCGPRWTDPDEDIDDIVAWGDVDETGGLVVPASMQLFQWVNVWGQDDALQSTCVGA